MKKIYLSFFLIAATISIAFAQVPASFNYQAVVRNSSGDIIANKMVSFRISLLSDSESGAVIYSEAHSLSTNDFGLVNLKIGKGTKLSGAFSPADWGEVIFTKIEFDLEGGSSFAHLATSKLSSVPYAFKAQTVVNDAVDDADADPANEIQTLSLNGTLLELSNGGGSVTLPASGSGGGDNWGTQVVKTNSTLTGNGTSATPLAVVADGDGDDSNELQTLSKMGNSINLSNGGGTITDEVDDADADVSNELQTLSINENDLTLSDGGGTVALPLSPWNETVSQINYVGTKNVYIGDISGSSLKTKSANEPVALPKLEVYTQEGSAISIYNESSSYSTINVRNAGGGTAAKFVGSSDKPSAIFDNTDVGLAAQFKDKIQIEDGTQGDGKVLTSDASGNASWQAPASGGSSLWTESGSDIYRASGKIGIGTANPNYTIDVHSASESAGLQLISTKHTYIILNRTAGDDASINFKTDGNFKFKVGLLLNEDVFSIVTTIDDKGLKIDNHGNLNLTDNLTIEGEIHSANTGAANMMPMAYGFVTSDGTLKASSGNVSVSRTALGKYVVALTGQSYNDDDFVAVFSHAHSRKSLGHEESAGKIAIYITKNSDDTYDDASFSFVIYKM